MRLLLAITCCYAAINVFSYALYARDKRRAQEGAWRTPERRLITLAVLGGALGAFLAMRIHHHKTRKPKFVLTVTPLMVLQVTAYALFLALALFAEGCYLADYEAMLSLESDGTVEVSRVDDGYLFDGPGTDDLLVFYPGGNVEGSAYAPLLHELAIEGMDCVVLDMPFNLAFLGVGRAERIIREYDCDHCYVGGHSLGGVAAGMFAGGHADELEGVVLLASYVTSDLGDSGLRVLSVYGTRDEVLNHESYDANRDNLPADAVEVVIDGGNHAQFGSYGNQAGDGMAEITAGEQRQITEDAILALVAQGT